MMNSSVSTTMYDNVSGFAQTVKAQRRNQNCPVVNNPLREVMEEEGRNLSPSQIAKEMLFNCRVMRRKDFTVSPIKPGERSGKDPNSPSMKSKASGGLAKLKSNLGGGKSVLGRAESPFILEFSPRQQNNN